MAILLVLVGREWLSGRDGKRRESPGDHFLIALSFAQSLRKICAKGSGYDRGDERELQHSAS